MQVLTIPLFYGWNKCLAGYRMASVRKF
ncbi:hypothetical protein CPT_Mangalyan_173 [Escherichia phage Mangalyan]|nr:hypothetical protein CPT_Mangalyan_173 [Escherichia phage Mangalyan]